MHKMVAVRRPRVRGNGRKVERQRRNGGVVTSVGIERAGGVEESVVTSPKGFVVVVVIVIVLESPRVKEGEGKIVRFFRISCRRRH